MQWDCRGRGEYVQNDKERNSVPPSLSAECLSDHWNGVISAAMLFCQDVCVVRYLWDNMLFD